MNHLSLDARISARESLRYTPAGVPIIKLWLEHSSTTELLGTPRLLECNLMAIVYGAAALLVKELASDKPYRFEGHIVARTKGSKNVVMEVLSWREPMAVA